MIIQLDHFVSGGLFSVFYVCFMRCIYIIYIYILHICFVLQIHYTFIYCYVLYTLNICFMCCMYSILCTVLKSSLYVNLPQEQQMETSELAKSGTFTLQRLYLLMCN